LPNLESTGNKKCFTTTRSRRRSPLYDTHSDSQAGGTGKTFDWSVLRDATTPFMLAGGLNPDNISDALYHGALGLDLNSGVEQSPGKKCAKKLNHAFSSIRNY